jgi:sporulation protein YlmC with PRC-barrel domain
MSRSEFLGVIFLAFGLASVQAQTQSSVSPAPKINYVQTSKIVGMKVRDSNGESVGTIKDVVLDGETGCIAYTVISTGDSGTRLTGTTKTVAVPWPLFGQSPDPTVMTLTVDRERLYGAPAFEYSRINEYSTGSYIDNIYSYYGVQSRMETSTKINAEFSAAPSPLASISAQTEATASPVATETPSPSPTTTPSPAETPSPTPSPTDSTKSNATVSSTPTAKPWAAAADRRSTVTPSPTPKERKTSTQPPGEGPSPLGKQIRRYKDRPTPSPTPKKTTW